jgi:hypothetical protein
MPGGAQSCMRAWEPEEDFLILKLVEEFGTKWAKIQKSFTNRSVASIRNRHFRTKKGIQLIEEGTILKNKCHACGQLKRGHICKAKLGDARDAKATIRSVDPIDPPATPLPKTQGFSAEKGPTEEAEPNVPLVLKDLFPNDSKAMEQASKWMNDRKNTTLVAGHLASLSAAVESQVKSMQTPLPLPPEFFPALKVVMPLSAYLAIQAKKAEQAHQAVAYAFGPREEWPTTLGESGACAQ